MRIWASILTMVLALPALGAELDGAKIKVSGTSAAIPTPVSLKLDRESTDTPQQFGPRHVAGAVHVRERVVQPVEDEVVRLRCVARVVADNPLDRFGFLGRHGRFSVLP